MFAFHIAFALNLISFSLGILLIVWAHQLVGKGRTLACVFGYIIAILAALVLICTIYYGFKGWYFFHRYERPMLLRMQQQAADAPQQNMMPQRQMPPQNPADSRATQRPITQDPQNSAMPSAQQNNLQAPKMQTPPPQSANRLRHPTIPSVKQVMQLNDAKNFNVA